MLSRIFPGFEFKAPGISFAAYAGDVELNVGRYGITAMWGDALLPGLFIRSGDSERHYGWPF